MTDQQDQPSGPNPLTEVGRAARMAAGRLARLSSEEKNAALRDLAAAIRDSESDLLRANEQDVIAARTSGLSPALVDRLTLTDRRLSTLSEDVVRCAGLPDPVGEVFDAASLANGLKVHKQRVPLGVLAVIYESRPNVTIDVAALALKTGNAVILRGGREAHHSNKALVEIVRQTLQRAGLPLDAVQSIDDPDRRWVTELLQLSDFVDMVIPRGGNSLHEFCRNHSRIPVITGGIGICHLFVEASADLDASRAVIRNAKIQRPTVCNALDTVLVDRKIAARFLPPLVAALAADGVSFRADPSALPFLETAGERRGQAGPSPEILTAGPDDFDTEWLSLVLGIVVVDTFEQAVEHIRRHGTGHSDGILTEDPVLAGRFIEEVDSAAVYVNASTRFTDGGEFGLGAEVAVSTQRLHARGPMGLRELTTYKWVCQGDYLVRP